MWLLFAIISAIFYSFRQLLEKHLVSTKEYFLLGWALHFFSLPLLFLAMIATNSFPKSALPLEFWAAVGVIFIVLYPTQTYFYYRALRFSEISLAIPLLSFIPIFTILTSLIILGEKPSFLGGLGIILITSGVYSLNISKAKEGFLSPIIHLSKHKEALLILITALCLSFGSTLDKVALKSSPPLFYSFFNQVGASVSLGVLMLLTTKNWKFKAIRAIKSFFTLGTLLALSFLFYTISLTTGLVSYVTAIKHSSLLLTIILGSYLFKEEILKERAFGSVIIVSGLILLSVS